MPYPENLNKLSPEFRDVAEKLTALMSEKDSTLARVELRNKNHELIAIVVGAIGTDAEAVGLLMDALMEMRGSDDEIGNGIPIKTQGNA